MSWLLFLLCSGISGISSLPIFVQNDIDNQHHSINSVKSEFFLNCELCKHVVGIVANTIDSNKTLDMFYTEVEACCRFEQFFNGFNGSAVCPGLIHLYGPPCLYVATHMVLEPQPICEELNLCPRSLSSLAPYHPRHSRHNVTKRTPAPGKPKHKASPPVTFVQLSDFHVDNKYTEGAPVHCGEFICCRATNTGTGSAGKYGEYNCDVPWSTVDVLVNHIKSLDPQPQFILYTGDSPAHDIWEETWSGQLTSDQQAMAYLQSHFPNISVYPTMGNHETFPQSIYYSPFEEYQNLNMKIAGWWQEYFSIPPDQLHNMQVSSYYTLLIRPGLRIISFNTIHWYNYNFYTLLKEKTKAHMEQIQFIEDTLHNASIHGEKIIMHGHIPPGDFPEPNMEYGDFYADITQRYGHIIILNLFGHIHRSRFEIIMDPVNFTTPLGLAFAAPSVTTEGYVNPAYWLHTLDGDTYELMDINQYYINITKANEAGTAVVEHAFSLKTEYSLPDMGPQAFYDLYKRMVGDESLLHRYIRNSHSFSGQEGECNAACRVMHLCRMGSASIRGFLHCVDNL